MSALSDSQTFYPNTLGPWGPIYPLIQILRVFTEHLLCPQHCARPGKTRANKRTKVIKVSARLAQSPVLGRGMKDFNKLWYQSLSSHTCDKSCRWKVHGITYMRASSKGTWLVQGNQWRLLQGSDNLVEVWRMSRHDLHDREKEHSMVWAPWWEVWH